MSQYDVLVVGGGPGGASTAYWAAKAGMSVAVVEKKNFPRDKTCGDGLTPRAIRQLEDMNVLSKLTNAHRNIGLRARAGKHVLELPWPSHPEFPNYGLSLRRNELDALVLDEAKAQGAEVFMGTTALAPLFVGSDDKSTPTEDTKKKSNTKNNIKSNTENSPSKSKLAGAQIERSGETDEIHARYVVIADGANSRFGRALETSRNRSWPQGMAIRTYYDSPNDGDEWLESDLAIQSRSGETLPGYGWIFPLGDGTINVGIGILSTFKNYKSINTSRLMEDWAEAVDESWEINPHSPLIDPVGGRLPMGGSVSPKVGLNWMVVGDAAGFVNPFNGEGIDYAYETGRKAAELLSLGSSSIGSISDSTGGSSAVGSADFITSQDVDQKIIQSIAQYPIWLTETYGLYFQVARAFAKIIGNPTVIKQLISMGMRSQTLMEWALRIMANILRPDEIGPAEAAYKTIASILKITSPLTRRNAQI